MAWNLDKNRAICPQLCELICVRIAKGEYGPNEKIPSVREIAIEAGVNPNTVQKAYRMLEEEGLITSHSGAKSYVDVTEEKIKQIRKELLQNDAKNIVNTMKQMGLTREEAIRLIAENWEEKQI